MEQAFTKSLKKDRTYAGWSEYDVKEKCWQVLTLSGEIYVKIDFSGDFIHIGTKKVVQLNKLFRYIRNCTDSEGYIIAKRKRIDSPLYPTKNSKKVRMPI
ncbi:hypothetical protein DES36_11920 [Alkalibaculum bacchi]|uniref:Uncharacterized protein n=1 Tax=Alkalibaculum bacchi TaxID=645887 RepID=A0A366I139_9FIRM|nr:hypothetical protein [Alkalibaculum bacchi]RBP59295.1 hypothetical protein DES36_11920 [Alkalibaculum bacchi]